MTSIALTDTGRRVDPLLLTAAARAIERQVERDLRLCWPIPPQVRIFPGSGNGEPDVVVAITPSLAPDDCGRSRPAAGPWTLRVVDTPGGDEWTLEASRQILEILVERALPSVLRAVAAGPAEGAEEADYPLSICTPCGTCGYVIDGVLVCDFVRPCFFTAAGPGACSFTGALRAPRTVLSGGWLAWRDPGSGEVRQLLHVESETPPRIRTLGRCDEPHLRDFVDRRTALLARANRPAPSEAARRTRALARAAAVVRQPG